LAGEDAVPALAVGLLGVKRQLELLADDACKESPDGMLLPSGRLHDRGDGRALGLAQQGKNRSLLGVGVRGRGAGGFLGAGLVCLATPGRSFGVFGGLAGHGGILSSVATASGTATTATPRRHVAGGAGTPEGNCPCGPDQGRPVRSVSPVISEIILFLKIRAKGSSHRLPAIVPHFLERRAVVIGLRQVRRLRPRSGADFVEQLTDKTERVNLIVVPAGKLNSSARKSANHGAPCRT